MAGAASIDAAVDVSSIAAVLVATVGCIQPAISMIGTAQTATPAAPIAVLEISGR